MRLIDADSFVGFMTALEENGAEHISFDDLRKFINEQRTAYDLKRVLDMLCEKIDPNVDMDTGKPCDNWVVDMTNETIGECIEIVRSGGVGTSD